MKAGDIISDEHGLQYELKSLLGKGLWSNTFLARAPDGIQWVLKIPLSASDFPSGQEAQAQKCRAIALKYGQMLTQLRPGISPDESCQPSDGSVDLTSLDTQ